MAIKTSGVTGTIYLKKRSDRIQGRNKWAAHIKVKNKKHHLGYFDNLKSAVRVRYQAEQKYNMVKKDNIWGAWQWLKDKKMLDKNDNIKKDI